MHLYGLIGTSLSHSFSASYFNEKFREEKIDAEYRLFPLDALSLLPSLLQDSRLMGLNVTIPYKQEVMAYCDALDVSASEVGAVNCISREQGRWVGYNTDVYGFLQSVKPFITLHHSRALVLGSGGASRAVQTGLQKLGIEFRVVSRSPVGRQLGYEQLSPEVLAAFPLIINTTPCGMYPHTDAGPLLSYEGISDKHLLVDLIYNPEKTLFLLEGARLGAAVLNGLSMLRLQAAASWEIWRRA